MDLHRAVCLPVSQHEGYSSIHHYIHTAATTTTSATLTPPYLGRCQQAAAPSPCITALADLIECSPHVLSLNTSSR